MSRRTIHSPPGPHGPSLHSSLCVVPSPPLALSRTIMHLFLPPFCLARRSSVAFTHTHPHNTYLLSFPHNSTFPPPHQRVAFPFHLPFSFSRLSSTSLLPSVLIPLLPGHRYPLGFLVVGETQHRPPHPPPSHLTFSHLHRTTQSHPPPFHLHLPLPLPFSPLSSVLRATSAG